MRSFLISVLFVSVLTASSAFAGFVIYQTPLNLEDAFKSKKGYLIGKYDGSTYRIGKKELITSAYADGAIFRVSAHSYKIEIRYLTDGGAKAANEAFQAGKSFDVSACERQIENPLVPFGKNNGKGSCGEATTDGCYVLEFDQCGEYTSVPIVKTEDYSDDSKYKPVRYTTEKTHFQKFYAHGYPHHTRFGTVYR